MANEHNLIPAKPGEVRNPKGKPKGTRNRSTIVREALEAILAGTDQQVVDGITAAAIAKALTGDIPAFKELMDSGYGKNPDSLTGANGKDLIPSLIELKLVRPTSTPD